MESRLIVKASELPHLQDVEDYLDDTGAEWEVSPMDAAFELRTITFADLERAKNRPLALFWVDMAMANQTRTKGPMALDADYSVIDGMHRLADMLKGKKVEDVWNQTFQAYVRLI